MLGMEDCAPFLVTTIDDTLAANPAASQSELPSASLAATAAVKASPAAVVSTAFTGKGGISALPSFSEYR